MKRTTLVLLLIAIALFAAIPTLAQTDDLTLDDCVAFPDESDEVRIAFYMGEGAALTDSGRFADALESYTCAMLIDADYLPAYLNRARVHFERQVFDLAIEDYTAALGLDPGNTVALTNRGVIYFTREQYDLARVDFDLSLDSDPTFSAPLYNRGLINALEGDFEAARADWEAVVENEGLAEAVATIEADVPEEGERRVTGAELGIETLYARAYIFLGVLDALEALETLQDYATVAAPRTDGRATGFAGNIEATLEFDLRFDDPEWLIRARVEQMGE